MIDHFTKLFGRIGYKISETKLSGILFKKCGLPEQFSTCQRFIYEIAVCSEIVSV